MTFFYIQVYNEIRNVTSGKLKAIDQSYLDAIFVTPESTLTVANCNVGNSNYEKLHLKFSKTGIFLKTRKKSYFENYQNLSSLF